MDNVTICIPVYERSEFLNLTLHNIKNQTYPHDKLTVLIDECKSNKPFIDNLQYVKDVLSPIQVIHTVYNSRSGIGEKRNRLVKNSKTKYIQFFDSDDVYMPNCIQYNYDLLQEKRVKCVGSDKMLFTYINDNYKMSGINCGDQIHLIHEATLFFDRKWFSTTNKFMRRNCGEGKRLFEGMTEKQVAISDVRKVMICLVHNSNTVPKERFKDDMCSLELSSDMKQFIDSVVKQRQPAVKGKTKTI